MRQPLEWSSFRWHSSLRLRCGFLLWNSLLDGYADTGRSALVFLDPTGKEQGYVPFFIGYLGQLLGVEVEQFTLVVRVTGAFPLLLATFEKVSIGFVSSGILLFLVYLFPNALRPILHRIYDGEQPFTNGWC